MNLKGYDLAGRAVLTERPVLPAQRITATERTAFLSSFLNIRSTACSSALLQLLPMRCQFQQVTGRLFLVTRAEHSTMGGLTVV